MNRTSALVSFLLVSILVGASAGYLARPTLRTRIEASRDTVFQISNLNFGCVWPARRFPWNITFHNSTNRLAQLTGLHTSCGCAAIDRTELSVEPGGSVTLNLVIDLLRGHNTMATDPRRVSFDVLAGLRAIDGDVPVKLVSWTITGEVQNPLVFSSTLNVGRIPIGNDIPSFSIPVKAITPVDEIRLQFDTTMLDAEIQSDRKSPHNFLLLVKIPSAREPVKYRLPIALFPITSGGGSIPPLELIIVGESRWVIFL